MLQLNAQTQFSIMGLFCRVVHGLLVFICVLELNRTETIRKESFFLICFSVTLIPLFIHSLARLTTAALSFSLEEKPSFVGVYSQENRRQLDFSFFFEDVSTHP